MSVTATAMDEAVARVNGYAIGAWLERFLTGLGLSLPAVSGFSGPATLPRSAGLLLRIDRVATTSNLTDPRDLFLLPLIEGDLSAPMPLGLDPNSETMASAVAKLSPSSTVGAAPGTVAASDRRVSFFMDGGRVIELRFGPRLVGFDRILIARLGEPLDWRDPANR